MLAARSRPGDSVTGVGSGVEREGERVERLAGGAARGVLARNLAVEAQGGPVVELRGVATEVLVQQLTAESVHGRCVPERSVQLRVAEEGAVPDVVSPVA